MNLSILIFIVITLVCCALTFVIGYQRGYGNCEKVLKRYLKYDEKPEPDYHKSDNSDLIWCNKCLHYTKGCVICHQCRKNKTLS